MPLSNSDAKDRSYLLTYMPLEYIRKKLLKQQNSVYFKKAHILCTHYIMGNHNYHHIAHMDFLTTNTYQ